MTLHWVRHAAAAALLVVPAACSEDGPSSPPSNGGTGGSSGGPGGLGGKGGGEPSGQGGGGSGGSSGAGGGGGSDMPDGGRAQFTAVLDDNQVRLTTADRVWVAACVPNPRVVQQVDGRWTPLRDDRPPASNLEHNAHYLDGAFVDFCPWRNGCDVLWCSPFPVEPEPYAFAFNPLVAREYVQVGLASAPECVEVDAGADAGVRQVPQIETRTPTGPLGVEIRYFRDSQCDTDPITSVVPID